MAEHPAAERPVAAEHPAGRAVVAAEHPVVGAARGLAPMAAAAAGAVEAAGRLPDELSAALTEAGLDHLYLPASAGGPEVDPVNALAAIEILARADASVAWCAHVSSANAWQLATLGPDAVASMTALTGPPRRFSGSNRACGTARPVEGGYVVSGQWDFASNCLHADWYCGTCVVAEAGRRRSRPLFIPMAAGTILPTWHVAGLRGTGSNDFAVDEVFVPRERVSAGRNLAAQPGPLYHPRLPMVVNWALTAGVALGVARGALDAFTKLAIEATAGSDTALRDRAPVQLATGQAEALLQAARSYCYSSIAAVWEAACAERRAEPSEAAPGPGGAEGTRPDRASTGGEVAATGGTTIGEATLDRLIPPARLAIVHALHTAVEVVDLLFRAGGTSAIFGCHGLERRFRDAHVALQHGAGAAAHFEAGGRVALGLPADAPLW